MAEGRRSSTAVAKSREVVISHAGESGPWLHLAGDVGGNHVGVGAAVGDHRHLGRPGDHVDTNSPEQGALGLGDIGVARADDHICPATGEQPVGQCSHTLHPRRA